MSDEHPGKVFCERFDDAMIEKAIRAVEAMNDCTPEMVAIGGIIFSTKPGVAPTYGDGTPADLDEARAVLAKWRSRLGLE